MLFAVAFVVLAALLVVFADGSASAVRVGEWSRVLTATVLFGLVVFAMYGLWLFSREKLEAFSSGSSTLGWYDRSLVELFKGPILHTYEGLILLAGSGASLLFSAIAWLAPSVVARDPSQFAGSPLMFALWPLALMVLYIRSCGPHFQSRALTIIFMAGAAIAPFYAVFK